ncbi:MAG: NRDE family protein [Acidobacteriota bacterium]
MCTVSWIHKAQGYELFCNRDERLTRKAALPPQLLDISGTRAIAPRDGDFGGSWISVNEFGLSLCLLNLYEAPRRQGPFTSRGILLMALADCRSRQQVITRTAEARLRQFQPFTLLALAVGEPALIVRWNGSERLIDRDGDQQMPLTSSSFDSSNVMATRRRCFDELAASAGAINPTLLSGFHHSHQPSRSAYSACMHRTDAETVSFSRITVEADSIEFHYYPQAPCCDGAAQIVELNKKAGT